MKIMYLHYVAIINRFHIILKHDHLFLPSKKLQCTWIEMTCIHGRDNSKSLSERCCILKD